MKFNNSHCKMKQSYLILSKQFQVANTASIMNLNQIILKEVTFEVQRGKCLDLKQIDLHIVPSYFKTGYSLFLGNRQKKYIHTRLNVLISKKQRKGSHQYKLSVIKAILSTLKYSFTMNKCISLEVYMSQQAEGQLNLRLNLTALY